MCSLDDDPSMHDPVVTQPRRYVLAGGEPPKPSLALAVIGEMLNEAEIRERSYFKNPTNIHAARAVTLALRTARQRIADAESGL